MTLQQLKYAITISEVGSLNKAAEALYVAQPSLSNAIKELENELGTEIFNRTGKGVTLTSDGTEFILHARQIYTEYENMLDKYGKNGTRKKKFGVSAQHYSFAVRAFVELVKDYDTTEYECAIRETRTSDVIEDVKTMRSEIGVLYLSDFNRQAIMKVLSQNELDYQKLVECKAYVYLWKGHPLAKKKEIFFSELSEYPCISFEQGEKASLYFSEELFSTEDYQKTIKVCDRATVLNLMVGLNGFTICSGIICEELNGDDYIAVPLISEKLKSPSAMEVGYVVRKNTKLSTMGNLYIDRMKNYLTLNRKE